MPLLPEGGLTLPCLQYRQVEPCTRPAAEGGAHIACNTKNVQPCTLPQVPVQLKAPLTLLAVMTTRIRLQ